MNICAPYWADCPISFKCRTHAKGPSDSQSTKHALLYPGTAKIVDKNYQKLLKNSSV